MLLRLTGAFGVTCAALIVAARLIGYQNNDVWTALFSDPSGARCIDPCLFGLRPGGADFEQAVKLLTAHPLYAGEQQEIFGDNLAVLAGNGFTTTINQSGGIVMFTYMTRPVGVGRAVSALGSPRRVFIDGRANSNTIWLFYEANQLAVEVRRLTPSGGRLGINDPVVRFGLASSGFYSASLLRPWRGFTTLDHYE